MSVNAPRPVVVLIPVASGDNGAWRRSKPQYRRHKAQRSEPWRPRENIPQLDTDRPRRLAEISPRHPEPSRSRARSWPGDVVGAADAAHGGVRFRSYEPEIETAGVFVRCRKPCQLGQQGFTIDRKTLLSAGARPSLSFDYADPEAEAETSLSNASSSEPSRETTAAYVDSD
jgi:hypothetical protein